MKSLIIAALVAISSQALANDAEKYVCQEYDRVTQTLLQRTAVLVPQGEGTEKRDEDGNWLGIEYPYSLEVFDGLNYWAVLSVKGVVLTEDVWFGFTSEDGKVDFHIYLDEMEESGLNVVAEDGAVSSSDFICR